MAAAPFQAYLGAALKDRIQFIQRLAFTKHRAPNKPETRRPCRAVEWREETEPNMSPNRPPINLAHQRNFHFSAPFFLLVLFCYLSNKSISFHHFLNFSYALPSSCTSLTVSEKSTHYSPLFEESRVFHNQNLHNFIVCYTRANCSATYGQIVRWAARKERRIFIKRPVT